MGDRPFARDAPKRLSGVLSCSPAVRGIYGRGVTRGPCGADPRP